MVFYRKVVAIQSKIMCGYNSCAQYTLTTGTRLYEKFPPPNPRGADRGDSAVGIFHKVEANIFRSFVFNLCILCFFKIDCNPRS